VAIVCVVREGDVVVVGPRVVAEHRDWAHSLHLVRPRVVLDRRAPFQAREVAGVDHHVDVGDLRVQPDRSISEVNERTVQDRVGWEAGQPGRSQKESGKDKIGQN
jgi:hypothetical protein